MIWLATLLCCAVLMLQPGRADCQTTQTIQTTGSAALLSDYRFRGESLTGGQAALQGTINFDVQGFYFGALASQAKADGIGLGTQAYAGFAQALNSRVSWELGAVRYSYSTSEREPKYEYTDFFAAVASDSFGLRLCFEQLSGARHAGVLRRSSRDRSVRRKRPLVREARLSLSIELATTAAVRRRPVGDGFQARLLDDRPGISGHYIRSRRLRDEREKRPVRGVLRALHSRAHGVGGQSVLAKAPGRACERAASLAGRLGHIEYNQYADARTTRAFTACRHVRCRSERDIAVFGNEDSLNQLPRRSGLRCPAKFAAGMQQAHNSAVPRMSTGFICR